MTTTTSTLFTDFADQEARGVSPLYEALAREVANRPELLSLLDGAPPAQRRATLFFAAVHDVVLERGGTYPSDGLELAAFCRVNRPALVERIASRRTQTNEVARSGQLVPALALITALGGWPVSLLEVGASAGLNLRFDDYRYLYHLTGGPAVAVGQPDAAVLVDCEFDGDAQAIPDRLPRIAERVGLDLEPIDLGDPIQVRWLQACIWADEAERGDRLQAAIARARRVPPTVVRGDATEDLERVAADVSPDVPLVVFHQALMGYMTTPERNRLRDTIRDIARLRRVYWLFVEGPDTAKSLVGVEPPSAGDRSQHSMVLTDFSRSEPASVVLALCDPHGRWLHWLAPAYDGNIPALFSRPSPGLA